MMELYTDNIYLFGTAKKFHILDAKNNIKSSY